VKSGGTSVPRQGYKLYLGGLAGCGKVFRSLLPYSYLPLVRGRRLRKEAIPSAALRTSIYAGCYCNRQTTRSREPVFRTLLELPGDRLLGKVNAEISGPDAQGQMPAEFGMGLANLGQRAFDRLGYRQPGPFGM